MNTAKSIIQYDDVIDECYTKLYSDAVNNVIGDPRNIERANYVIYELVIYMVTGEHLEKPVTIHELTRLK